jgi:hypothetical protein
MATSTALRILVILTIGPTIGCTGHVSGPDGSAAGGEGGGAGGNGTPDGGRSQTDGSSPGADSQPPGPPAEFAVAPNGDDNAPGTLAQPFATLERARDAVRAAIAGGAGATTVWIRGGVYERGATLALDTPDAGKANAPVIWRGYQGEKARLVGGRRLDRSWLEPVTSAAPVWARIAPVAQGKVMQVNLPAHGITSYGTLVARGFSHSAHAALELFIDGAPQTLARWPDLGSDPKTSVVALSAPNGMTFGYVGDEPSHWSQPAEAFLHGLWGYDWADDHLPIAALDTTNHTITLGEMSGYPLKDGQPFYAENILEELTVPGEFYLDRTTGLLYLWPPDGASGQDTVVSLLDGPLVRLAAGAAFVTWQDLTLEDTRSTLLEVQGSHDVLLSGLLLRNSGTTAVTISGNKNVMHGCEITGTGDEGVTVSGGDRKSLTAAGNVVEQTHIHHWARFDWMYKAGIHLSGVGNIVRHNLLHDAPHAAILYGGNEHLFELNEIHHVCQSTSDAGAMYSGRDWGARGNIIRHNFIHDIQSWRSSNVHGIYLDDTLAGIRVEGNVLYKVAAAALKHGGGRDDIMINNVIARCATGLATDARGSGRETKFNLVAKLDAVGYQMEPWKSRYPACAAIPDSWDLVSAPGALWLYPQGSIFSRNIGFANTAWIKEEQMATTYFAEVKDDVADQDPLFTDEAKLDLSLRPGSPALMIPGFQPIPFADIGIK